MSHPKKANTRSRRVIVATSDIAGFARAAQAKSDRKTFAMLTEFYEIVGSIVEHGGGQVVKFMGDAALMIFPVARSTEAVRALRSLREKTGDCLTRFSPDCQLRVKTHVGSVMCGVLGTASEKRFDVIGKTVNELFKMPSGDFVLSTELKKLAKGENR